VTWAGGRAPWASRIVSAIFFGRPRTKGAAACGYALSLRYAKPVNQATCRRARQNNHTSGAASIAAFGPAFLLRLGERTQNPDSLAISTIASE
jgi:hypothetical protein